MCSSRCCAGLNSTWGIDVSTRSSQNRLTPQQQTSLIIVAVIIVLVCACAIILMLAGRNLFQSLSPDDGGDGGISYDSATAELTVAVSPGMAPTFNSLVELFNANAYETPDGSMMLVRTVTMVPEKIVEQSLQYPAFQAIAPDSSIWLNQIDRQWADAHSQDEEGLMPIGNRRVSEPVRYATVWGGQIAATYLLHRG